jgi:Acetyltransferases, including N-acetylases of ribosomal proteins
MLQIEIDSELRLEKLRHSHAKGIFSLVNANREYLRKWLAFVDTTKTFKDTEDYINQINRETTSAHSEIVISIIYREEIIGVMGIKKVDWANRIVEVGYWLAPQFQGKGIITRCCSALVKFAFNQLGANRIEIKCGVGNDRSSHVPQRLGFTFEGVERDGELLNGHFIDIEVYSLLKREWQSMENAYRWNLEKNLADK